MRPGTNSLAFFTYVNKALLQFILQKLLSSNVDIFWSLLLFESAVRSLGVLPRVSSILELLYNCCVLKKPQFVYICHKIAILIILGSIWWSCMGRLILLSSTVTACTSFLTHNICRASTGCIDSYILSFSTLADHFATILSHLSIDFN